MRKILAATTVLLISGCSSSPPPGETPIADQLISELATCDSAFFKAVKRNEGSLRDLGPIVGKADIAYFKVPDRSSSAESGLIFSEPVQGQVQLVGYFDELVDLGEMGTYYSWGFLAKGEPGSVASRVKSLVKDGELLRMAGGVMVRSEVRDVTDPAGGWVSNTNLSNGTIPKVNTAERVFLVEPAGDEHPDVTRIGCSIQGAVSSEILAAERPDISVEVPSSTATQKSQP